MRHIRRARPNGSCVRGGNGNLANDGTLQLSYDAFNRLILVKRKSDGATIGQYVYDALNRRTRKTISNGGLSGDIPNGTTDYLYQDWQIVEERSSSTTLKQFIWGQYIDECIQMKTLTTTGPQSLPTGDYYPLQDLLYRTTALTDDEGNIVEAYDYDAYGNTLIFSAAGKEENWWADDATQANYAACEVLYAGYRYDAEAKLYQVRNREYNPVLGRWLQRDPIGFEGGDWNLYGYVKYKSTVVVDWDGQVPKDTVECDIGLMKCTTDVAIDYADCTTECVPSIMRDGPAFIGCTPAAFATIGGYALCLSAAGLLSLATYNLCQSQCNNIREIQESSCYCAHHFCIDKCDEPTVIEGSKQKCSEHIS